MAGEWLKWSKGLTRKPEILQISARLMLAPAATAGTLMVMMEWLDDAVAEYDENGNANVTLGALPVSFVDQIVGVNGFAESLAEVGWMRQKDGILTFINAGRHNGNTAKNRALTRDRVANFREKGVKRKCNAASVTKSVLTSISSSVGSEGGQKPDIEGQIYDAYPRKTAKQDALKAIRNVLTAATISPTALLQKVTEYASAVAKWPPHDRDFIPHPATWFNRGSYDDDPKTWERHNHGNNRPTNTRSFANTQDYSGITDK